MKRSDDSLPEQDWDRFLREATAGTGAADAPKEPSARARMVTRRLQGQPPPEPPRAYRLAAPAAARGRRPWFTIVVAALVVLAIVAFVPGPLTGLFRFGGGSGGPAAPQGPTVREPFRDSPAEDWAGGADGIDVPVARATGGLSAAGVGEALGRTKNFLAGTNLDPGVLRGERPTAALRFLDPRQKAVREYVADAFGAPGAPGAENDPLRLATRFDPERFAFAGDVVKTRGGMTVRAAEDGGIDVRTDVTFVYPVVRASGGGEVVRTIVRRAAVLRWPAPGAPGAGTFQLVSYASDVTNGGCGERKGYFSPEFGAERATVAPDEGVVIDPYDRAGTVDAHAGARGHCAAAVRS
ncbi:hypothetical protein [Streptomyces sp. SPB074]|uniref:hypothetical protein n=1 Tax=Streptomyces sp. (strain SPB074) TaxID=465543 RepID=UPI00017F2086|nr:hypothetical protein [Streptomyces sp. SPB074]EDY44170.1 membrane protein [Streptomyces sp. SPB074]